MKKIGIAIPILLILLIAGFASNWSIVRSNFKVIREIRYSDFFNADGSAKEYFLITEGETIPYRITGIPNGVWYIKVAGSPLAEVDVFNRADVFIHGSKKSGPRYIPLQGYYSKNSSKAVLTHFGKLVTSKSKQCAKLSRKYDYDDFKCGDLVFNNYPFLKPRAIKKKYLDLCHMNLERARPAVQDCWYMDMGMKMVLSPMSSRSILFKGPADYIVYNRGLAPVKVVIRTPGQKTKIVNMKLGTQKLFSLVPGQSMYASLYSDNYSRTAAIVVSKING